ncbi:30429_t:CDS:2, partial [Gigaspora margarita]
MPLYFLVAKDAVRDLLESSLKSPLVPYIVVVDVIIRTFFRSSDFKARETILTFLEVVGHALLESLFVQNGDIGIGACAVGGTLDGA